VYVRDFGCMCVCTTAMYVARVRSGVSAKSDNSGMRLAPVGKITNTNHRIASNRCSKTPRFHAQFGGVFDICLVFDRLISMPKRQSKTEHEGKKMNALIKELTEQLPVASDVQKSIANRLESALTKTGSASSRLRMASQSLNALANKYEADTDENGYADLFARIFAIGAEIGVDNKKPATEKTKRENWHDADSVEAQKILSTKKPRKSKPVGTAPTEADIASMLELIRSLAGSR
jgi:hypothetical protein